MKKLKLILKFFVNIKNWIFKSSLKVKIVLLICLIGLIWFLTSIFISSNKNKQTYQTSKVERGTIISSVSASGQVLTVNIMSATTKASGIVKEVYVKDGDIVKKGDNILKIELDFQGQQKNSQAWASYLSAKNNLENAKIALYTLQSDMFSKWDTFKELATNSTYQNSDGSPNYTNRALPEFHIAEKNWLATEAKYKNQEAVITQAQVALNSSWLDYTLTSPTITAPTDGTITSLMFTSGMSIGSLDTGTSTSNQKVATIETGGNPVVSVNLSEIDVSQVKIDQKATITLDSISDKTFTGIVVGVNKIGETTNGVTQYPSIIQLDSTSNQILPNMTVTAIIIIDRKDNSLIIPSSAVKIQNEQSYVEILENGKPKSVLVETGLTSDTKTEIKSGLKEGDTVITGSSSDSQTNNSSSPFNSGFGQMRIAR